MKRLIGILGIIALILTLSGCWDGYSRNEISGGAGFITFTGNQNERVEVTIDGVRHFTAEVRDVSRPHQYAAQYRVTPGRRNIRVESHGRTIFRQSVNVHAGQVRTIFLR